MHVPLRKRLAYNRAERRLSLVPWLLSSFFRTEDRVCSITLSLLFFSVLLMLCAPQPGGCGPGDVRGHAGDPGRGEDDGHRGRHVHSRRGRGGLDLFRQTIQRPPETVIQILKKVFISCPPRNSLSRKFAISLKQENTSNEIRDNVI